jgi:hypothetical protein
LLAKVHQLHQLPVPAACDVFKMMCAGTACDLHLACMHTSFVLQVAYIVPLAPTWHQHPLLVLLLLLVTPQAKEHLFSMLVWHERLLYDPARQATLQAAHAVADKLTKLGTGLRWLLGSSK